MAFEALKYDKGLEGQRSQDSEAMEVEDAVTWSKMADSGTARAAQYSR